MPPVPISAPARRLPICMHPSTLRLPRSSARRLRQDAFVRQPDVTSFAPEPEENTFEIVRTKRFPMKPMTHEEAILQMELLEHSFFAFKDEENDGAFAVVYKRNDGGYGLIEDVQ